MFVLGVTGGIGSGKSTVSQYLADKGITVLDADEISRQVTAAGGLAIPAIEEVFGKRAVRDDGSLNRKYVSGILVILMFLGQCDILTALTSVARYELASVGECGDGETAVIGTSGTLCVLSLHIKSIKFRRSEDT